MATHPLLQALRANQPAFGAWLTSPGLFHARALARSSPYLSWIAIDCEHGIVPLVPGAAESTVAIESAGVSSLVRISATGATGSTSWQIKHALDAGARGVIVPMVNDAEKAREIVGDCKFPPKGRRGFGSVFTHATWNMNVPQYLESANESILVMIQIETKDAVDNVKEIANVDGVDVLFIGPYDLSMSLGYPPPSPDPHPHIEQVIQKILNETHDAGKKCAIFCLSGKQAAMRATQGFDMINVVSDMGAMSEAVASHVATAAAK